MDSVSLNQLIFVVLDAIDDPAQIFQAHGIAIAVRHDQRGGTRRVEELAVRLDGKRLLAAVESAGGQVDVRALNAACTSSTPMPRATRTSGLSCTRTAYFEP